MTVFSTLSLARESLHFAGMALVGSTCLLEEAGLTTATRQPAAADRLGIDPP